MSPAAFLPQFSFSPRPASLSRACHSAACPLRRAPSATLSIPQDHGQLPSVGTAFVHTEKTKRKIGEAVMRRAAIRRARAHHFMLSLQQDDENEEERSSVDKDEDDIDDDDDDDEIESEDDVDVGEEEKQKPRRRLSAESKAKISAALKGRRKSAAHRKALRARFEGDRNPMYGRKLSKESRAKISAAMMTRSQKRRDERKKQFEGLSKETMVDLRDKAAKSRLFTEPKGKAVAKKKRSKEKMLEEQAEAKEIEELLTRVSRLDKPPENVAKTLETNRKMREGEGREREGSMRCECCKATGFVKCPECVGAFGVTSGRCDVCFGAGAVFCEVCQGVGQLSKGGVC